MENEKKENLLDKLGINFHRKLSFKIITISILIILLLVPKVMILSLIEERSKTADEAKKEVMALWSDEQHITGPVLMVPYRKNVFNPREKSYSETLQTATFLPKSLRISGQINPEKLYRSIYDVVVYQSDLILEGSFEYPDFAFLNLAEEDVFWEQATIQLAISDLRGINNEIKLNWQGTELAFTPGLKYNNIGTSGISVASLDFQKNTIHNFKIELGLKGSKSLQFTPVGEKTEVRLSSNYNDPGFVGNFLPAKREISTSGFLAEWNILHFNRNYPQQWTADQNGGITPEILNQSDFGVELVTVADNYQKNMRSAKYAILIILIVFTLFFMFEVFTKHRIHPFQYVMVGSALILFYLLLLSVTEQLGFNVAYIMATLAVSMLVTFYSRSFLPNWINSLGIAAAVLGCFGFVFVLLQLESLALLVGSVGLFVLLAALMFATRKINWYNE